MNYKVIPLRSVFQGYRECCMKGCDKKHYARGLCQSHYSKARYLIKNGIETWISLIRNGKAQPARSRDSRKIKERMRDAIKTIHGHGEYPSAARINSEMGRTAGVLRGNECKIRREIFRELGIEVGKVHLKLQSAA